MCWSVWNGFSASFFVDWIIKLLAPSELNPERHRVPSVPTAYGENWWYSATCQYSVPSELLRAVQARDFWEHWGTRWDSFKYLQTSHLSAVRNLNIRRQLVFCHKHFNIICIKKRANCPSFWPTLLKFLDEDTRIRFFTLHWCDFVSLCQTPVQ